MDKVGVKVVMNSTVWLLLKAQLVGVVIPSGTFTQEARDFARGKPLELLDGSELLRLIAEVQKTPMPVSIRSNDSACPLCGAEMALRTAKKGPQRRGKVLGLLSFSEKCRGTKPYSA